MKTTWRLALLVLIVTLFSQNGWAVEDEPAYRIKEGRRNFNSPLLVSFQDWTVTDVKHAQDSHPAASDPAAADHGRAIEHGRVLWERHGATLENLLKRLDEFVMAPLPRFTRDQMDALRVNTPVPDYRYCREIARGLVGMAACQHSAGRDGIAVNLLITGIRAGQIMAVGDGDVPPLITGMIGIAMQKACLNPLLWKSLESGRFSGEHYRQLADVFARMVHDQTPFTTWLDVEHAFARSVIENNLFCENGPSLGELLTGNKSDITAFFTAIPVGMKNRAKQQIMAKFDDLFRRQHEMLERHGDDPREFRRVMKALLDELQTRANPSISKIFSPIDALGDILVSIVVPNWNRALEQYQALQLKLEGVRLLCLALAVEAEDGGFPVDLTELARAAGGTLKKDWFSGQAPRYRCDTEAKLWSVGENLINDGGETDQDLILFQVTPRSEISLSRAIWLDISEGKPEQAIPLYRVLLHSADPTVKAKARERLIALEAMDNEPFPLLIRCRIDPTIALIFPDPAMQKKVADLLQGLIQVWWLGQDVPPVKGLTVVLRNDELKPENLDLLLEFSGKLPEGATPQPTAKFAGSIPLSHSYRLADDLLILTEITSETALRSAYTYVTGDSPIWPTGLPSTGGPAACLNLRNVNALVDANRIVPLAGWPFRDGRFTLTLDGGGLTASPWPEDTTEALLGLLRGLATSAKIQFHGQRQGEQLVIPLADLQSWLQPHFASLPGTFALADARARYRACMANVKVLEGATEMYRMDKGVAEDGTLPVALLEDLVKLQYLRSAPICANEGCHYLFADGHWSGSLCGAPWIRVRLRHPGKDASTQFVSGSLGDWLVLPWNGDSLRVRGMTDKTEEYRAGTLKIEVEGYPAFTVNPLEANWIPLSLNPPVEIQIRY